MPVIIDNSTQLQTANLNTSILANAPASQYSSYTPLATFNASNTVYNTAINAKQNLLISTCNLAGIGSAITALDYANITLNKPTNFQADWNSTVINKPTYYPCDLSSYYTKSQVDNIGTLTNFYNKTDMLALSTLTNYYTKTSTDTFLNAKQNTLNSTCNLVGNGSAITALNYNNITNAPNLSGYATISSLSSYQPSLTGSTVLSGIGSNLTLINYNTLSNLPNLSQYLTASTTGLTNYSTTTAMNSAISTALIPYPTTAILNSCNYITAATSGLTNYSTTTAMNSAISTALTPYPTTAILNSCNYITSASLGSTYLQLTGGSMTGVLNITSSTNTTGANYTSIRFYNGTQNGYIGIGGTTLGGTYQANLFIETTNSIIFATGGYNTTTTPPRMILNASGNLGIGTANSSGSKLEIYGNISLTNNGTINFDSNVNDYKLNLWGGVYGIGIKSSTLAFLSQNYHNFYNSTTPTTATVSFDSVGNITAKSIKTSTTDYSYIGGLRVNGYDTGNTIYQDATTLNGNPANIGFTLRDNNTFNFYSLSSIGGGYTNLASMNINGISLNKYISTPTFTTSSLNNLVMKTMTIPPYAPTGGAYNNGFWLIDVQDYCSQISFVYLFLNLAGPSLYWQGRILIANSSSMSFYSDIQYNVQISLNSYNSRLQLVIQCPSGTNSNSIFVKVMG